MGTQGDLGYCRGALLCALIGSPFCIPGSAAVYPKACDGLLSQPRAELYCHVPLPRSPARRQSLCQPARTRSAQSASLKCQPCGARVLAPLLASAPAFISNLPSLPAAKFFLRAVILRPEAAPSHSLSLPPSETSPELLGKHFACCYYSIPICMLSHKPLLIPAFFWGGVKSSNPSFFFWGWRLTKAARGEIVQ